MYRVISGSSNSNVRFVAPLKVDPFQERLTVVKFSYNTMKSYIKHIYVPLFTRIEVIINFYLSLRQKASLNSRRIHFEHIGHGK
jgi:hypothetical protein